MAYKLYDDPKDRMREALHPFRKKYHRDFYALRDINLEVKRGEILGIVGKNGSGKSTLLKIISRVLHPTKGTVQVNGRISALLELGSGFNPEFTGMENIFFYGSILGFSRSQMDEKVADIVDFADIGQFIHQPIKTYSSGMKARLAFAVSTAINPEILILDEVLAVGDELFKRKCYARMESVMDKKQTILFVSHAVNDINQLCEKAILLDVGAILLQGPAKEVTVQYQRLLFANPTNARMIRNEIISFDTQTNPPPNVQTNESGKQSRSNLIGDSLLTQKRQNTRQPVEVSAQHNSFFIPDLQPQSTTEYKNYDVLIQNIKLTTLCGSQVNVLLTGEEYIYQYSVTFNTEAYGVLLGTAIKTEKGLIIGGATFPEKTKPIEHIELGTEYLVRIHFKCSLLTGTYYTDTGVTGLINSKRVFLNRIVDALVFKILGTVDNHWGIVSLNQTAEITELPI